MAQHYNLDRIRSLLSSYFTGEQFRQFCLDTPEFKALYHQWDQGINKAQMIDDLLDFAKREGLLELLLKFFIGLLGRRAEEIIPQYYIEADQKIAPPSPPPPPVMAPMVAPVISGPAEVEAEPRRRSESAKNVNEELVKPEDVATVKIEPKIQDKADINDDARHKNLPAPLRLRLDVAVPDRVEINRAFDLAVAVRQLASPILKEDDLPQIKSGDVQISWPEAQPYVNLRVEVSAPDCGIDGEKSHAFRLYQGQDSPVFYFHLTPTKQGPISIIVTVYQQEDGLGSARVHTTAYEQVAGTVQVDISSRDLTDSVEQQIINLSRRLDKLREIKALKGIDTEPHILIEIEDIEKELQALQAQRKLTQSAGDKAK